MRLCTEVTCLLMLSSAVTLADPRSLTVVPHPLEFDPRPELVASTDKVKAAWVEAVREAGDVVTPSRRELDAALLEVGRRDCRTSNDCLAALAVRGAGLYAVHAMLELSEGGVFLATARVVRDDGRLMASFTMEQARGDKKKPLVPLVKQLLVEVVKGLGISRLPAFKEAVDAPPPAVVLPVPPPPPEPELRPPPIVVAPAPVPVPSARRPIGFVIAGLGGAALAGGVALLLVTQGQARALMPDVRGHLTVDSEDTRSRARAVNTQHFVSLGLLAGGGLMAGVGLLVALLGGSSETVSVLPMVGGLAATVGGLF